jgi:hypothetical protein
MVIEIYIYPRGTHSHMCSCVYIVMCAVKKCLVKRICQDCINRARRQIQLNQFLPCFLKAYPTSMITQCSEV